MGALSELDDAGGVMPTKELETRAKQAGYSYATLRRAKDELKASREIRFFQTGGSKDKVWHVQKVDAPIFTELPANTPTPWTNE